MFVKRELRSLVSSIIVAAVILFSASDEGFTNWINLTRAELSPFVIYAEIEYPLTTQPETITINPPRYKDNLKSATIGFVVYHKFIPVYDFRSLAPDLELNLNWKVLNV